MTAESVWKSSRDQAAEVAYPTTGRHRSVWPPMDPRPTTVPVIVPRPVRWTVERCATVLGVEPFGSDVWRPYAACADCGPTIWFPERGDDDQQARHICNGCDVRAECLAAAMNGDEQTGTWGGVSANQRRHLRLGRAVNLNPRRGVRTGRGTR